MKRERLNLAGVLAKSFITSKLTVIIILAVALLGVTALLLTPREENPQIVVPSAQVSVRLPGASASEVENLIIIPLEGILSEMKGVDHTFSVANNSVGVITVQFKPGQPKEESLVKLYDRVLASQAVLPADASTPHVRSLDVDDVPIVTITLASRSLDDYALKRLADRMSERLRSLNDVSVVSVYGGRTREIDIKLDPERLEAFGITLNQFYAALNASNVSIPLEKTIRDGEAKGVKLEEFLASADEVRSQVVGVHAGRPIYVSDIAQVTDGPTDEVETFSRFSFGPADPHSRSSQAGEMPAVTIAVAKKKGTNAVEVAHSVLDRVERIRQSMLPSEVDVVITRNDGKKADDAVNVLVEHLFIAVGTVALILVFSLGWREAAIVCVTVPMTLCTALAADLAGGVTINRITLYSLILSLGLLVDASIVVIENIHRRCSGIPSAQRSGHIISATNEIGNATNLATLAIALVFGSMILLTGMGGQYFFPVTYNLPIVMIASVVIAYIVTPWAANRWLHHESNHTSSEKTGILERTYNALFLPLQQNRKAKLVLLGIVIVGFSMSMLQGTWQFIRPSGFGGPTSLFGVALGFLPKDNKNTFNIIADMPENTPVEDTNRLVRDIEDILATCPNVLNYQSWLGKAGVPDFNSLQQGTADRTGGYVGEIRVNLLDKHSRSISSIQIVQELRKQLRPIRQRYPGCKIRLVEDPPGPPLRAMVLAEVYGPDQEQLRSMAGNVYSEFAKTYDMVDLSTSEPVDVAEHRIVIDKEKAALSGVSVQRIALNLQLVFGGALVSRAHPDDEKEPVDIRVMVPRSHEIDPTRLDRVFIDNDQGNPIPLSELVTVRLEEMDRPIFHKDNERVSYVGGELSGSVPLNAVLDLNHRLKGMPTSDGGLLRTGNLTAYPEAPDTIDGYQLLWDGEMRLTLDIYRDMTIALAMALTLVFLLLVAYYKSFRVPIIAMCAIPLGLIGLFPGHWLLGADFSATSMVGIIALSGVVIRNSLLIIDFVRANQAHGMNLEEAIRKAGAVRLRPIILTTLAIVMGSLIMIPDPVFGGLAITLIFGSVTSAAFTVFVVPLLYQIYAKSIADSSATEHA